MTTIPVSMISFRPSKIAFYTRFFKNENISDERLNYEKAKKINVTAWVLDENGLPLEKTKNQHKLELSKAAQKNIQEKITWLHHLSKQRTVVTSKNKTINAFRLSFVTLTLPAQQFHTSQEITQKALHQFITVLTERHGLKNYVWRLEYQKNGNAHYHIATDLFLDYDLLLNVWNGAISKLGYIDKYREQMASLSLQDYLKKYANQENSNYKENAKRYFKGKSENWSRPNTIDVKCVTNNKNVAYYISKYFIKKDNSTIPANAYERDNDSGNMRLWYCSQSLSRFDKIVFFQENLSDVMCSLLSKVSKIKEVVCDYCMLWFFNVKEQSNDFKRVFYEFINELRYKFGFVPSGG